ncbi:hypothetical protein EW146_g10424 [Bondarzewia mesenterica]|uniref:Uncharacterized protein n=1 Tax=Bondarzewia mesenterica TaxID=1095465 RepID=A0A4S4L240_9AGAM|nr:hypothetical protein EW146_g10424 [Bondarzewia mesenterica]
MFDPFAVQPVKSSPGDESIYLSDIEHPFPVCFSAAVSKVLDDDGIPNFLWGDLLNWWRGNPHVPSMCGFVVPGEYLDKAIAAITRAGLPECTCTCPLHVADPASGISLPVHFLVPQPIWSTFLFLCTNETLLNLIPLTPAHPNPASLQYDRLRVSLQDHFYLPRVDEDIESNLAEGTYVVNVLTAASLFKALLLLDVFSPPDRVGIGYMYAGVIHTMTCDATALGLCDFGSRSLQRLFEKVFVQGDSTVREAIWTEVRMEWTAQILSNGQSM